MFQASLLNYQIHVVSKAYFNAIVYQGPDGGIPVYLYNHDDHFNVTTSMTGFLNRNYFCKSCEKGYQHLERHACNRHCHFCRKLHTDDTENWQHCEKCNCKFINETCFELHKSETEKGKSTCEMYYRCTGCNQLINRSKHYCCICKDFVTNDHLCYMQPFEQDENTTQEETKHKQNTFSLTLNAHRINVLNVIKVIFLVLIVHV
jgi:hypothetical protein